MELPEKLTLTKTHNMIIIIIMSQEILTQYEIKGTMQHADMLLRAGHNKESIIPNASLFDDENGIHYNIRSHRTNANRFSKGISVALSSMESGNRIDLRFSKGPFWLKDRGMLTSADKGELLAFRKTGPVEVGRYALIATKIDQAIIQANMQNEIIVDDEIVVNYPSLEFNQENMPQFLSNEAVLPILAEIRSLSPDNLVDR